MRYTFDPPKSPLKRGTFVCCTSLQRKALYLVTLTNFDKKNSLLGALNKVFQNFQVKRYSYLPITEQTYEQARIFIFDPIVVNGV